MRDHVTHESVGHGEGTVALSRQEGSPLIYAADYAPFEQETIVYTTECNKTNSK